MWNDRGSDARWVSEDTYTAIRPVSRDVLSPFLLQAANVCLGSKLQYQPTSRGNFTKHHLSNLATDGTNSSVFPILCRC